MANEEKILNYVVDNKVYILGKFDESISQNVVPNLIKLIEAEKCKKESTIEFYINSVGGYVNELYNLLSIIEIAKKDGIKIVTINMGNAYSCGSLLAVVGNVRKMFKYATNLMHLGLAGASVTTLKQIERNSKHLNEHFNNIIDIYKKHTKMSEKDIRKNLEDDDYYLNASECLKYGLVDEIIGE